MGRALNPKSIQLLPHPKRTRGILPALLVGLLSLFILCCSSFLTSSAASDRPLAWIALGPGGQSVVRAVTTEDVCPALRVDTQPYPLQIRSRPVSSSFPILICEVLLPSHTTLVTVAGVLLSLPKSQPEKIVILGDTGCRVKGRLDQACNNPDAWPFARIARSAAAWQPDLVIHLGDYFYRDSPCPIGNVSCAGSPWGDNWAVAQADFFSPARPLLQVAPWIFVRGNHEACSRSGEAWFRLLDPRPLREHCTDETQPYVVPFGERDLFVLDTTNAHDSVPRPDSVAYFVQQFSTLAEQSKRLRHCQRQTGAADLGQTAKTRPCGDGLKESIQLSARKTAGQQPEVLDLSEKAYRLHSLVPRNRTPTAVYERAARRAFCFAPPT